MEQPNTPIGQLSQQMAQGVPTLDQNTAGSPNFDPSLQPPMPGAMPQGSPMTAMDSALHRAHQRRGMPIPAQMSQASGQQGDVTLPIEDNNPQQPGVQVSPTEAELILKAMDSRLKHHSKITEHLMKTFLPQPQETPQ